MSRTGDPERWKEGAKCRRESMDVSFFFPSNLRDAKEAKAFCGDCPVRDECFMYAIANEIDAGIWGGTGPSTRKETRKGDKDD